MLHSSSASLVSGNLILANLPTLDLERIGQHLRPTLLHQGQMLYQAGRPVDAVYFVTAGMVSITIPSDKGEPVEVGIIGPEGVSGAINAVTEQPTHTDCMVQIRGKALVMPADVFREEFKRGGALQNRVLQFFLHLQMVGAQCAMCNTQHSLEERLARWLLMVRDRVHSDEMELTHEFISQMLGVRRSGVTITAGALRTAGTIEYSRGMVRILNSESLQTIACECYPQIRRHLHLLTEQLKA